MSNNLYSLKVLREGLLTTIQDFGFKHLQHYGIPNGGAIDILSFTYNGTSAFWTVGNDYT